MKYAEDVRGHNLTVKCPHCSNWNDWDGDITEGRSDLRCGHCRKSYELSEDITIFSIKGEKQ